MIVRTFSRVYPKNHSKSGEPTYFVEKILRGFWDGKDWLNDEVKKYANFYANRMDLHNVSQYAPKWHTIRAGHWFKPGDYFIPRVWSGEPYRSKQIQFTPPIEVKKTWDFILDEHGTPSINEVYLFDEHNNQNWSFEKLSSNDGLSESDMIEWFNCHPKKKSEIFDGQIICWNSNIEYL